MAFEIQKPLFNKISDRFGVQQGYQKLQLAPQLVATTDADKLMKVLKGQTTSGTATNRSDNYIVPAGKKWTFISANWSRTNAGINVVRFVIDGVTYGHGVTASGTDTSVIASSEIIVNAGDTIELNAGTGTSGSIYSYLIYLEEDGKR